MVRLTARYDGKVLIPENAVNLPTNVPLRVTVDTEPEAGIANGISGLEGLGAEIWQGIDPLDYQRDERRGWE